MSTKINLDDIAARAAAGEQIAGPDVARLGEAVIALRAESEQVRRFIASSKEVAEAGAAAEYQRLYDDLRDRCTTAMDALAENSTITMGACPFCGEAWPTNGCDRERRAAIAAEHDQRCSKNPIRIERDALRTALIEISTLQIRMRRDAIRAWATRETANDLGEAFSAARVEALLAEELEGEPTP